MSESGLARQEPSFGTNGLSKEVFEDDKIVDVSVIFR